jgi:hypothetical protein
VPASVRSDYEFFKRLYNASAKVTENTTPAANRIGLAALQANPIFEDFPTAEGFVLKAIDIKEAYNLLNSPGEYPILFAGQGCHNTQAIIGAVATQAKAVGAPVVYVVDFALDSNVKFDVGSNIDTATANSATGGLWVRTSATASANKHSYLYGELVKYFKDFITQNSSAKDNSIAYYPN